MKMHTIRDIEEQHRHKYSKVHHVVHEMGHLNIANKEHEQGEAFQKFYGKVAKKK